MAAPRHASSRGERALFLAVLALALAPLVVGAFRLVFAIGGSYYPSFDMALFELGARDVGHHAVLVGPYSRFGWYHPGPLLYYVIAVPFRLFGSMSVGMDIAALLINGAAIVGIAVVARRRGGMPLVLATLLVVGLLTRTLGMQFLWSPWNPYVPLLPLVLVILLAWSVAVGDAWTLPAAVGVASFVMQTHVGYALVTAAVLAFGLAGLGVAMARSPRDEMVPALTRRDAMRALLVSALVAFVLWLPPLSGAVVRHDGNLGEIVHFFLHQQQGIGWRHALHVVALQWAIRPEWSFRPRPMAFGGAVSPYVSPASFPLLLVLAAGAVGVAAHRRSRETLWLAGIVAVGLVAAIVSVHNVAGLVYPYVVRWTWALGALLGLLVVWGAWLAVPPARRAATGRRIGTLVVVALVVLSGVEVAGAVGSPGPEADVQPQHHSLTAQVLAHIPTRGGPVLFRAETDVPWQVGIALQLLRHGVPFRVERPLSFMYSGRYVANGGPYRAVLTVVSGPDEVARFARTRGQRLVADWQRRFPRPPRRFIERLLTELRRRAPPDSPEVQKLEAALDPHHPQAPDEEIAVFAAR